MLRNELVSRTRRRLRWAVRSLSLFVLVAAQLVVSPAANAVPGDLDASFGVGGRVTTDFALNGGSDDEGEDAVLQPDGKIVAVGTSFFLASGGGPGQNFILARYHPNGSLDTSFGTGGKVASEVGGTISRGRAVALQPDGKIVVAGLTWVDVGLNFWDWGLARYNTDGSLDATFGTGGVVTTDFFEGFDDAEDVLVQPDGKIVVAGEAELIPGNFVSRDAALARYNPDGSIDTTFGVGGVVTTELGSNDSFSSLVLQPDGKIVAGGDALFGDFALVRYNADGSLDPAFGTGGLVTTDFGGSDFVSSVALQPDGRIVAAGSAFTAPDTWIFSLARYTSNGALDPAFGVGGKVTTSFGGTHEVANAVAIQPDGKIVAGGAVGSAPASLDFGLARYHADGSLDALFGVGGRASTDFSGNTDNIQALVLQPDGKIAAVGTQLGGPPGEDFALARYQGLQALPTFTFTPSNGPVGWPVSITGTGLTGTVGVTFNGVAATFTVDSDTHITATVPVGATTGSISVTTPAGTATSAEGFVVTTMGEGTLPVTEYPVESSYGPGPIAAKSSAKAWFALPNDDAVGRINWRGRVTLFPLPSPFQEPRGIAKAKGGRAWFTQTGSHEGGEGIGLIDRFGTITEFELPANTRPFGIAKGPDGNAWFTEIGSHLRIGRVTPTGEITEFPVELHGRPLNIVAGPDGAVWFTEDGIVNGGSGAIGRITTSGAVSEYVLPTLPGYDSGAGDITVGPDGNLWFTWAAQPPSGELDAVLASVGRITPSGVITEFPLSAELGWPPGGIARGRDGNLWLTRGGENAILRISVTGTATVFPLPNEDSFPSDISRGNHGAIWFSEADAIGRFVVRRDGTFL